MFLFNRNSEIMKIVSPKGNSMTLNFISAPKN